MVEGTEPKSRVLSLEVRPTVVGFAVFDVSRQLMDYGRCTYRVPTDALSRTVAARMSRLIERHQPSLVVTRQRAVRTVQARERVNTILRVVRREAGKRHTECRKVSSNAVRSLFASRGCTSKYGRAGLIARQFPQLSWKLPRKRKPWNREDSRMVIFDAAATVLTFLNQAHSMQQ